jgi:hypothetical protein
MADEKKDDAPKGAEKAAEKVASVVEQETEQGFRGTETDPTPNENYTVEGVTSGAPTPETDHDAAVKAQGGPLTKFNNKQ